MQPIDLNQDPQSQSAGNAGAILAQAMLALSAAAASITRGLDRSARQTPTPRQQGHKQSETSTADATRYTRYEKKPQDSSSSGMKSPLNTNAMDDRSRRIVNHENNHAAILRDVSPGVKPEITRQQGPDGRKYAVAGEVNADLDPVPGNSGATAKKAEIVYRSAMGDPRRSAADAHVGRSALETAQSARKSERDENSMSSPDNAVKMKFIGPAFRAARGMARNAFRGLRVRARAARIAARRGRPAGDMVRDAYGEVMGASRGIRTARGFAGMLGFGGQQNGDTAGQRMAGGMGTVAGRVAGGAVGSAVGFAMGGPVGGMVGAAVGTMAGGAVGSTAAGLLAGDFKVLGKSANMLADAFKESSEKLKYYSPQLAVAHTMNIVKQFQLNREQGRQLGPGLAEFERQRGKFEMGGQRFIGDLQAALLPGFNEGFKLLNNLTDLVRPMQRMGTSILKWLSEWFAYFVSWGNTITDAVKRIFNIVDVKVLPAPDPNMINLFKMQMPPQGAQPNAPPAWMGFPPIGVI